MIVGFEEFQQLPTIVIAYLEAGWSKAGIQFLYYNAKTEDKEICAAVEDELELNKQDALAHFDREIMKKQREVADLEEQKEYFQRQFGIYWQPVDMPVADLV